MNKQEFINELKCDLSGLSDADLNERLNFYSEMIDDRIDEGLSEEEAVSQIGSVNDIISQIASEMSLTKLVKEKIRTKRVLKVWEIILIILGSPVWVPILISLFAVIISVYISVWSVIISLWAAFASVAISGLAAVVCGFGFMFGVNSVMGAVLVAVGLVCMGVSVFLFYGCKYATYGVIFLTKKVVLGLKNNLIKGRAHNE